MNEQTGKHNYNLVSSKKNDNAGEIYASFHLSNGEFAVAVSYLQEVVDTPEGFIKMPLSPDYLLGLFNLRGMVIPVIDLSLLLGFQKTNQVSIESKIGILELNGHLVGLLFVKTGEVFKSSADEKIAFVQQGQEQIISGVFKKENGTRLIQLINPINLFKLEALPKQLKPSTDSQKSKGLRKQSISFLIEKSLFALNIECIQEIIKINDIRDSALATGYCIGLINVRGLTVPLIDFPALLGFEAQGKKALDDLSCRRVIVMMIANERFGLLVDSVESNISYFEQDLKSFPVLSSNRAKIFQGCIVLPNQEHALLLNSDYILSNQEVIAITHGHSTLYSACDSKMKDDSKNNRRITYVTFVLETIFAIPITKINEIIEEPEYLIDPVGLPEFCKGIINLRGEMVIIIDGRKLYQKNSAEMKNKKVLIFKGASLNYGLVVDAVEEIITLPEANKIKMNTLASGDLHLSLNNNEALQFYDKNEQDRSILIMNPESIEHQIQMQ